ncbi:Site-specific integrase OS=Streptomyces microflavus OX=1919 GN=HUT09_18040 PE=4 SV=1 [Streptomyces microflavus]
MEASKRRDSARWVFALALGLRQGEALGLRWVDVYLDAGYLRFAGTACARGTSTGAAAAPCGRKAGYCPDRRRCGGR